MSSPEWPSERIGAYVASVECIYLGLNFISNWKEKKQSSNEDYENILGSVAKFSKKSILV